MFKRETSKFKINSYNLNNLCKSFHVFSSKAKKSSLVYRNWPGDSPARTVEFVSEYLYLISKNKQQAKKKQEYTNKKQKKLKKWTGFHMIETYVLKEFKAHSQV